MGIIRSIIDKVMPSGSVVNPEPPDHFDSLDKLRKSHEWIEVQIVRSGKSYQSLILNIDLDNNELLIDEFFPPENLQAIEPGDRVEVSSQSRSKPVNFYTQVLARKFEDNEGAWLLELPSDVGRNLNRSAFRVYVENEQNLNIEMMYEGEPLPFVRIINLSAEGIKLGFSNESQAQLDKQQIFNDCLIRLPSGFDIDCHVDLRSVYSIHTPKPHILGGGKLTIDNPQHLVKLQQYLAELQRRQRRGEMHIV